GNGVRPFRRDQPPTEASDEPDFLISIAGEERVHVLSPSVAPSSLCNSLTIRTVISPDDVAAYWNAAGCLAGIQVAVGANSPTFLGKLLWHETRIPLLEQSQDTRTEEQKAQMNRPRVWFGERWITSAFDLFEENARYFSALLPKIDEEDPLVALEGGGLPCLQELVLHNSTIFRWNRPVFDVADGRAQLGIENRVLPVGPTPADIAADCAFYIGLMRSFAEDERPLWTKLSFDAAEENFHTCSQNGITATIYWPGLGLVSVTDLVLQRLLPLAQDGLARSQVDGKTSDLLLGNIEQRCVTKQNGATWQLNAIRQLEARNLNRREAIRDMTARYVDLSETGQPVHTWAGV
ncbi:glutamate--cysteine ligase, partial [Nocardioides taihuensis]